VTTRDPVWLFAERLRELRDKVERGKQKPTLDLIVKIAHALKLKPYELIKHIP
jgi:transcriptional regulator with XRE-family HTH domain